MRPLADSMFLSRPLAASVLCVSLVYVAFSCLYVSLVYEAFSCLYVSLTPYFLVACCDVTRAISGRVASASSIICDIQ